MKYENVLEAIGRTPLIRLNRLAAGLKPAIYVKADYLNPGGSVKDRIGVTMIDEAERKGWLKPGGTIIEGTSGNTGMGLALVAAIRGYKLIFTITDKQSREKINLLKALGAEVIVCPTAVAPDDPRSYYSVAKKLAKEIPNSYYPNQYDNPMNPEAHYRTTGPEIWEDSEGKITHLVAGLGTGGTICGISRFIKEKNPKVRVIGADPIGSLYHEFFHTGKIGTAKPYVVEGIGEDIFPSTMDFKYVDDVHQVTDRECFLWTRKLLRYEGIFAGGSTGAALAIGLKVAKDLTDKDFMVIFIPDSGARYLSKVYNDEWMQEHRYLESPVKLTAGEIVSGKRSSKEMISAKPADSVMTILATMQDADISQLPVLEDGKPVGAVYEDDIVRHLLAGKDLKSLVAREVMQKPFPTVPRDMTLDRITELIPSQASAVFVDLGKGKVDIITKYDLVHAITTRTS
ncbi:MAG TPA: pyridoxal-phosphate dependent enzyme [Thermoanaerobaculia bacterium]|nr:pyridoxal-phosphate dependent enzyme [Thermoanaerobaculia bacterium]